MKFRAISLWGSKGFVALLVLFLIFTSEPLSPLNTASAATLDLQVGASGDDGRRRTGGTDDFTITITDSFATGQNPSGTYRDGFMRFTGVTVPAGSTVSAADIEWKSCSTASDGTGTRSNIYLEDADNPAAPTTAAEYDSRTMTTTFTAYDDFDSTNNAWHNSPDISGAVQEVINRPGWASGQAVIVYWRNDASDAGKLYCAHHYDASPGEAIQLHITYTAAGDCTPSGDQPNAGGDTTVDEDTLWCGDGNIAGGNVTVGNTTQDISFTMQNGSVEIQGNMTIMDASTMYPVNWTMDNFTVYMTLDNTRILIERVPTSLVSYGATIRIENYSLFQGNVSDTDNYPDGLRILSGEPSTFVNHTLFLQDTNFTNLGDYWGNLRAALDTHVSGGLGTTALFSQFVAGSYIRRLNFTNPSGMNGSAPADSPVAVFLGDSLPIQNSEFFGGFMGAGFTKWQWDNRYHSVCRMSYDPEIGSLLQNNTYIAGDIGSGCKHIDFFRGNIRFRNNTISAIAPGNENIANDADADDNIVENNTFTGSGVQCAGGINADRIKILNNTFSQAGTTDGMVLARCNQVNVSGNTITDPFNGPALAIRNHPSDSGLYQGAEGNQNNISVCGSTTSSSDVCLHYRQYNGSSFSIFNLTGNDAGWSSLLENVHNTTFNQFNFTDGLYAFRATDVSNLTFIQTIFSSIVTSEWFLDDARDITIRNQGLETQTARVDSVTIDTMITWNWTNLAVSTTYNLSRTPGGGYQLFTTDSSGNGEVPSWANPTGSTYTYSLATWSNTAPIITNPLLTDEGGHNITYSQQFNATDPDTNQTLLWTLTSNATFLSLDSLNRTSYINGTPSFSHRDSLYYVNTTTYDEGCGGGCNLTDFTNYTLYINNTLPTITNPITTDEGGHNISYSRDFNRSDANSDTGIWLLVTNATFLSIDTEGNVSGTPLFVDRDSLYFVNITFRDYSGGQGGIDYSNFTLWINNTIIIINNKISTDSGLIWISYSYDFNHDDANNDTPTWSLETNAPFTLFVFASGLVTGVPDIVGTFWVNVTIQDYSGGQGGIDWVNYTLTIQESIVLVPIDNITMALFFMVGFIPFLMSIGIGFWKEQGTMLMIGGIIGVILGIWVMVALYWVFGFTFVGISILFMYIGWVNTERGNFV